MPEIVPVAWPGMKSQLCVHVLSRGVRAGWAGGVWGGGARDTVGWVVRTKAQLARNTLTTIQCRHGTDATRP